MADDYETRKRRLEEVVKTMTTQEYAQMKRDAIEKLTQLITLANATEDEIKRVAAAYVNDLGMDELLDITNPDWLQ